MSGSTNGGGSTKGNGAPRGVASLGQGTVVMDPDEIHPPGVVMESAANCVRFVLAKLKIELDFQRDTLSLLDHYVADARAEVKERPEAMAITAHAVGAYLGEVARRSHACWWRIDRADPGSWRLEFRNIYLAFYPVQVAYASLNLEEDEATFAGFEMPDDDRSALTARLDQLPSMAEDEYFAPSTRLEVLDIAVDALLAKRAQSQEVVRPYGPDDYS